MCRKFSKIINRFLGQFFERPYTYESRRKILNWPLLSINIGFEPNVPMPRARGIIAIGNAATGWLAIGMVYGRGGIVVAPLALGVGVISVAGAGLVSVCVFGIGIISVSIFALGYLAVGIVAVGIRALGIFAVGDRATGIIGFGHHIRALKF